MECITFLISYSNTGCQKLLLDSFPLPPHKSHFLSIAEPRNTMEPLRHTGTLQTHISSWGKLPVNSTELSYNVWKAVGKLEELLPFLFYKEYLSHFNVHHIDLVYHRSAL